MATPAGYPLGVFLTSLWIVFITICGCPHFRKKKTKTKQTPKSYVLFYFVPDFMSSYFLFLDVWFLDHTGTSFVCPKSSQTDNLSPVTFFPSWSHYCCIHTPVWWIFCSAVLQAVLICIVLLTWLTLKTLHHKTPLPASSSCWHHIVYHIHSLRQFYFILDSSTQFLLNTSSFPSCA